MPYSVTKPFAAVCALVLVDRGLLDLDAPVQRYWPELSSRGHACARCSRHQSGLVALSSSRRPTERSTTGTGCARGSPRSSRCGSRDRHRGESALFYGHLVGELVRRVDGRTLGRFLREEVCGPLGLDFPSACATAELGRVADLTGLDVPPWRPEAPGVPRCSSGRCSTRPERSTAAVVNSEAWRRAEIPAVNGHGTARAVAGLYAALLQGRAPQPALLAEAAAEPGVRGGLR